MTERPLKTLPLHEMDSLFQAVAALGDLFLPLEKGGQLAFDRWTPENTNGQHRLDRLLPNRSCKDLFLPQTEALANFVRDGKKITIEQLQVKEAPFVVFGVRACDAGSLDLLDRVFLAEPVDTFYQERRKRGTVVTLACNEPEETCFCGVFDIDAAAPGGDVSVWMTTGRLYWQSRTEKGDILTASLAPLFEETTPEEGLLLQHQEEIRALLEKLPLKDLNLEAFQPEALHTLFSSPLWQELSRGCIGCGTCTFTCPTCQCYDINDYDTGNGIRRTRCWDSCMYSDFVRMAHGNPRTSQVERFRQRFMHKLVYYPANQEGLFSCVGCGRCLMKCPSSMNIAKVARALSDSVRQPEGGNANV